MSIHPNPPYTDVLKSGKRQRCFTDCSERPDARMLRRLSPTLIPRFGTQKGGDKISKAGKFKSSKITALCNEQSQIKNFEIGNGGESDHKAVISIIPSVPANVYVTADRGFDSKKLRRILRHKGSRPLIPRRQFPNSPLRRTPKPYIYKSRWQIEKAFSETDQFRKLLVRQERDSKTYKQYWYFGLAWLELKKLTG